MNIGDIYSWAWKEVDETSQRAGTTYWCMDQYCVAVEDRKGELILIDTYNHNEYASDDLFDYDSLWSQFPKIVDPAKVDLKYLGNINDYERTDSWKVQDYKSEDILIIPCQAGYRKIFLKKIGSKPDADVMIKKLENDIESYESDIRIAKTYIKFSQEEIARLMEGI